MHMIEFVIPATDTFRDKIFLRITEVPAFELSPPAFAGANADPLALIAIYSAFDGFDAAPTDFS